MSNEKKVTKRSTDKKEQQQTRRQPNDKQSLIDNIEDQLNVDLIPMEDLKLEQREEKDKHKTKRNSSSESKYK